MTDRLLTEQERHKAWANSASPAHGEMALKETIQKMLEAKYPPIVVEKGVEK